MTIESQLTLIIIIVIVFITMGRFSNFDPKDTLPNPEHFPMLLSFFIFLVLTIFYVIKTCIETFRILKGL